jgi:nucleoside-diphosphate-sugar epimerase
MHVLITGAAGFIGQLVARKLLNDPSYTVILADIVSPPIPAGVKYPNNAQAVQADLCAKDAVASLIPKHLDAVFAFHGIMSAGSEADFDLGMRANVDATRNLLEGLRSKCPGVRFIYASGEAVYGRPFPDVVDDTVIPTPQTSYGAEKLVCEILVNEYTRRGFVDGLSLRFPTISVRPGKPTAAASSFLSGLIREPMDEKVCEIPVEDRQFGNWVCSPRTILTNLIHALTMSTKSLPLHIRSVNMPGIYVTIQDMRDALEKVGGKDKLALLHEKDDPAMLAILRSWPTRYNNSMAFKLGFIKDESFEVAVRDYADELNRSKT